MIYKLRLIFIFLFVLSVFSLTLQSSIINLCKESKTSKSQNQTSPVEEEESNDTDEDVKLECYLEYESTSNHSITFNNTFCFNQEYRYPSQIKSIPIQPPKF
jgi:hypothetical protein